MREGDDRRVAVGFEADHGVVGHAAQVHHAGQVGGFGGVFLTRVTDQHLVVQRQGHLRQVLRHLARANEQEPPMGAVGGDQAQLVEQTQVGAIGLAQACGATGQAQLAAQTLTQCQTLEEFFYAAVA